MADVLVLQHTSMEGAGTIAQALARLDLSIRVLRADLHEPVPLRLSSERALVIMGGPMGVYEVERYPFLADEMRLIEAAIGQGAPVLGVCLGSELIAGALGARVAPGSQELGWYSVTLTESAKHDPLFAQAPNSFTAFHWHGDVFDLPEGAVALARSERTAHQAFRYSERTWALLFHLEINGDKVQQMVSAYHDELVGNDQDAETIRAAAPQHLAALQPLAERVFDRWARLVGA